jgi:hypothetical protein
MSVAPACLDALPLPLFREAAEGLEAANAAARELLPGLAAVGPARAVVESRWREQGRSFSAGGERWLLLTPPPAAVRLADQHAALGRFAGGLTHNLNNPLNALSGMVQLLMFRLPDLPDLAKIDNQTDELARMIRQVGDRYRRLTDWPEGMPLTWEDVLREELVFFRANMIFKHRCSLQSTLDGATPCVLSYADAAWLFGTLLEAVLVLVPPDGQQRLSVDLDDGWPRIRLDEPATAEFDRTLAALLDGRVAELLARHGRSPGWRLDAGRLELGCFRRGGNPS